MDSLIIEIKLQKEYLQKEEVNTLYFGGGTPSLLANNELQVIFDELSKRFRFSTNAEITLEANLDDLDKEKLNALFRSPINRLSIGIQSFNDKDLVYLNRAHTSKQAKESVLMAKDVGFENISVDLIYGIPGLSNKSWINNLDTFFDLDVPHLSAYALTVEKKTALDVLIRKKKVEAVDEQSIVSHFNLLNRRISQEGFVQYEISNYCREPYYSEHNRNYWFQKPYLGLGPSAHSYNGSSRQWNEASIKKYVESLQKGQLSFEDETLTEHQQFNEYIMTSLRTMWGIDVNYIGNRFGTEIAFSFQKSMESNIQDGKVFKDLNFFKLTDKGKLFADGIASELFL